MNKLVRFALLSTILLVSCLHGPPDVPPSTRLSPAVGLSSAHTKPHLAVVFAGPRGTVEDRREPAITVLFNRSMRAIEAADDGGLPGLRVETAEGSAVAGTARWLGTHGLLFIPDAPLTGATSFAVTVPAGARSVDGDTLALPYRFEFATAPPVLVESEPAAGATDVRPTDAFRLVFNEAVDPAAVEHAAKLTAGGKEVPFHAQRASKLPPKTLAEHVVSVVPNAPLPLDSALTLTIGAGLRSAEGPRPMTEARTIVARTYGPLRLDDVRCPKVSLGRCQAHRDVTVVLSNAVSPDELRAHVRSSLPRAAPQPPPGPNAVKRRAEPARALALSVDPREGKRYRVTLTAGMRDVFGQRLAKNVDFDVDIEAAFAKGPASPPREPKEAPQPPEPVAPSDDATEHRAVLQYEATIGIEGNVLESARSGGGHMLPVGVVNLPTYGVSATALRDADALRWLAGGERSVGPTGGSWRWDWISPGVPENTRSVRSVDLDALLASTPGARAALVGLAIPGQAERPDTAFVGVTDLGVSARLSRYGSLVWVTRLSSGAPVADAQVALRTQKRELFATTTDAHGVARIPATVPSPIEAGGGVDGSQWLFVRSGEDWVYQSLDRSTADERAAPDVDLQQRGEWEGLVFTDRGVYRPGEALRLSAIVRKSDATGLKVPASTDVRIEMKDAQDERVFSGHATTDAFGELSMEVPLPRTAHLGSAVVSARVGRGDAQSFTANVVLAAYKASEFQVEVDAAKPEYVRGEVAEFSAKATYLYGAPMAGASSHDAASRTTTTFSPPGSDGFTTTDDVFTSDYTDTSPRTSELHVDDGELDADGRLSRSIALDMPGQRGPEIVTFESQVEDLTRQTVAQSATVLVHPAPFYVGLRRPSARFVSIGAVLRPDVVAFEPSGAHRPGVRVRVDLMSRVWTDVAIDEAASVPRHVTRPVDAVVASCDVSTTASVAACPLRVSAPGYYILRATTAGPVVRASSFFYALDDRSDHPPSLGWSDSGGRALRIESDKETYSAGDTAQILIGSPFKEADALVTVERAGVLWQNVVHVKGPLPVVSVPIAHEYYPNVFVGVHLVRGRVAGPPAPGQADLGAPDFRTGTKEISIDPGTHRLAVDVHTAKAEYHPGDDVDAEVHVKGPDGHGVRASVTFYAVDEGVLMLTGYKTPDPLPAFAEHKRLADFGIENREHLAHFIALKNGERVPILGFETPAAEPEASKAMADKGESGGGGDSPLRADFRTTVAFEAGRVTSDEGAARFSFRLPDNLTRFRLMAVVASADDRFGFGDGAIASSRQLMARPAMPRVVRVGDAFDASVVVSAKSPSVRDVTVDLDARGVALSGPRTQTVALPARGQAEVRFPVRATAPGDVQFVFGVHGGGLGDRVLVKRTVDLPVDVRSSAVYGEMTGDTAIALGDLAAVRPDRGALHVRLATTALVGIDSAFDQLDEYPYGCTEQLTSRALPLLALDGMAKAFHVRIPASSHDRIDDAVGALLAHQHGSGGFGYWDDDPEVPWLSAYAAWALETAAKKGYFVPPDSLDRAIGYLRTQLNKKAQGGASGSSAESDDESSDSSSSAAAAPDDDGFTTAFIADVLAEVGAPDPGALDRAFEERDTLPLSAQALVLHAMAVAHMRGSELATLAKDIEQRLRVGPSEVVADAAGDDKDLDSSARTTALVLRAFVAFDPKHPLAARLARGLLGLRSGGAWRSTQENLWALVALDEYRQTQESQPAAADVETFLGADLVSRSTFRSATDVDAPIDIPMDRVTKNGAGTVAFRVKGGGKVFYSAELEFASTDLPTHPDDSGFFVQRLVRAVKPNELAAALKVLPKGSVSRAEAGDLVLVDLLVESAEPRDQVVIEDPLPSGLEAIDFDLDTSSKVEAVDDLATEPIAARAGQLGYGGAFATAEDVHREVHDDRVLTFARHIDPGMYHFRYLARASTLGHFVVPPAEMRCMYAPEVTGRTGASTFDVVAPSGARIAEARP